MASRRRARRGVLLLIVLSLLVLFLMVGVSFMVSANQFNRVAKSSAKAEATGMPGNKLADQVMYQILRGTKNPHSSLRGHSLLEDIYGRDHLIGQAVGAQAFDFNGSGHQIQQISVQLNDFAPNATDIQRTDDYYGGCVLTYLNGPAAGQSTRILLYQPSSQTGRILVKGVPVQQANGQIGAPHSPSANERLRFIISGRPFNGTGGGYNQSTGQLDALARVSIPGHDVSTLPPIPASFALNARNRQVDPNSPYEFGGVNESWDAVDYQNMFLAKPADIPGPTEEVDLQSNTFERYVFNTRGSTPSFHRPYLVQYLQKHAIEEEGVDPVLAAQIANAAASLRPSRTEHPSFSGSNPNFDSVLGPWDVDNDGDGTPESIWVDAGLAPVSGPDGRLYKPLVATYVLDMDSRVNLNAVDSIERWKGTAAFETTALPGTAVYDSRTDLGNPATTAGRRPRSLAAAGGRLRSVLGMGTGPADIRLVVPQNEIGKVNLLRDRLAGSSPETPALQKEVSEKVSTFAELSAVANSAPLQEMSAPGKLPKWNPTGPFFSTQDDQFSVTYNPKVVLSRSTPSKLTHNTDYRTDSSLITGRGSPLDMHGRCVPIIDAQGNIVLTGRFPFLPDWNNPYEINLLQDNNEDNPFDIRDLEAITRLDDTYASQSRLRSLVETTPNGSNLDSYANFTTRSFSVPSLPSVNPYPNRVAEGLSRSLRDMFARKIMRVSGNSSPMNYAQAFNLARRLMAPAFARGEKLDLNEVMVPHRAIPPYNPATASPDVLMLIDEQNALSLRKELFARYLFNLAMLLSDDNMGLPSTEVTDFASQRELHVRRIAQWAVNVVDFGDADSVMTRFRYDVNPFDAADPFGPDSSPDLEMQGDAQLRVVWGMEHPELLLTETLAFHDRRAEDTSTGQSMQDGDEDLDSVQPPQGSAFVELYCPRSQRPSGGAVLPSRGPEDLWTQNGNISQQQQLILDKQIGPKPVWRLAISEITEPSEAKSPNLTLQNRPDVSKFEPLATESPNTEQDLAKITDQLRQQDPLNELRVRRFVWFTQQQPVSFPNGGEDDENTFFNVLPTPRVNPGDYVLVMPDLEGTPVGLNKSGDETQQQIAVRPPALPIMQHYRVDGQPLRTRLDERQPNDAVSIGRVVPVVARNNDARFNISEPIGGYEDSLPSDTPLDSLASGDGQDAEPAPLAGDLSTGVRRDFRSVFLQRLANPNLPWHAVDNPYRTIDWMPFNLTVFNSLHDGDGDPDEEDSTNPESDLAFFASLEKTGLRDYIELPRRTGEPSTEPAPFNIWSSWTAPCPRAVAYDGTPLDRGFGDATQDIQNDLHDSGNTNMAHSLGWLNRSFDSFGPEYTRANYPNGAGYSFQPTVPHPAPCIDPWNNGPRYPSGPAVDGLHHYRDDSPSGFEPGVEFAEAPISARPINYFAARLPQNVLGPILSQMQNNPQAGHTMLRNEVNARFGYQLSPLPASAENQMETTFPTLVWNNRPYLNPYELMLVPACSSARLSTEYTASQPYSPISITGVDPNPRSLYRGAFGHLMNFYASSAKSTPGVAAGNLYRIFDFVSVPSPFAGTETWVDQQPWNGQSFTPQENPFFTRSNYVELATSSASISEFREPGKVNINTANDEVRLMLGFGSGMVSDAVPIEIAFENTLAGYTETRQQYGSGSQFRFPDGDTPAEYPNPFRMGTGADLIAKFPGIFEYPYSNVDATLLRTVPNPNNTGGNQQPVLGGYREVGNGSFDAIQNNRTNAYFRFKDLIKLGNSVSAHSNVYAIWVTVGYFEIEPNYPKLANGQDDTSRPYWVDEWHPDGYRFGVELGSDLGQVTRHRSFYIVDRSIPVAFEPGENHNVDDAILLRRHLE